MKNIFTLFGILWLSPLVLQAQTPGKISESIYTNEVKATALPAGQLFFYNNSYPGFQFPGYIADPNQQRHTIFAQSTFMSAVDENSSLIIAGVTYGQNGSDFVAGPMDLEEDKKWHRVFKISAHEISVLKEDFDDNGTIDVIPSRALLEWPGKGNPHFYALTGLQLPDREMAPFFDRDQNGIYDPYEGDYPILGYDCADVVPVEMAWTLFHDNTYHQVTHSSEILVEIATTVFSFGYTGIEVLDETVFVRQEIRNKRGKDIFDVRLGHYVDIDIGCHIDDAIGCDPGQNTFYGYNRDEVDKISCPAGIRSYG